MTEYTVRFTICGRVTMDVEADTEEEAIKIAADGWEIDDIADLYQDGNARATLIK